MHSESKGSPLNKNLNVILFMIIAIVVIALILFRNLFFQSTYLLKSFGQLSVDPEIAF